jgi:hypothetical protein
LNELIAVVEKLVLSDESDALVWGVIISQDSTLLSLYICYHQLHNKLATVDKLNTKGFPNPTQCSFYNGNESIKSLIL